MANGALGRPAVFSCGIGGVTCLPVKPPQTGGNTGRSLPSRSRCWNCAGREVGQAIGVGKFAIERIEAAILGIEHNDRIDLGEIVRRSTRLRDKGPARSRSARSKSTQSKPARRPSFHSYLIPQSRRAD